MAKMQNKNEAITSRDVDFAQWYPDVCREDIEVYGKRGIRNFTSFGVYMDGPYMKKFPNVQDSIREYSQILAAYQPGKQAQPDK